METSPVINTSPEQEELSSEEIEALVVPEDEGIDLSDPSFPAEDDDVRSDSTSRLSAPERRRHTPGAVRQLASILLAFLTWCGAVKRKLTPLFSRISKLHIAIKIGLIAAVILLFVLVFALFTGNSTNPEKVIDTFVTSVQTQNFRKFSSVSAPSVENWELTQEDALPFFTLCTSDTDTLASYQETLLTDLTLLESGQDSVGNGIVRLTEKKKLLRKAYCVELCDTEVTFTSVLDHTQVDIGNKSFALDSGVEVSLRLLPGCYDITMTLTNEVLDQSCTTRWDNCVFSRENNSCLLQPDCSAVYLGDIGLDIASITVNGTNYGPVTFNDAGEFYIAPLPREIDIVVNYDIGGVVLSDRFTWSDDYCVEYFYPTPVLSPETAGGMLDQVGSTLNDMLAAYGSKDLAALEAMPAFGESSVLDSFYHELKDSLDAEARNRYVFHYTLREMQGDLAWTRDFSQEEPCFYTTVFLGLDYIYDYYRNGELYLFSSGTPETYHKDDMLSACIRYTDGQWIVSDLDWVYFSSPSDIVAPYTM